MTRTGDAQLREKLSDQLKSVHALKRGALRMVTILEARLRALDSAPGLARVGALSVGAAARARLGAIGGRDHGANARHAFIFEHIEIALLALLEQLAERCGDDLTARAARECRKDDEGMAATINENWPNVLSLTLASAGLPTARPDTTTQPVGAAA